MGAGYAGQLGTRGEVWQGGEGLGGEGDDNAGKRTGWGGG